MYPGCRYLAFQWVLSLGLNYSVITIFTFLVYLCYLVFQLFSHKNLYDDHHSDVQQSTAYPSNVAKRLHIHERKMPPAPSPPSPTDGVMDPDHRDARSLEAGLEEEEEMEEPAMSMQTTIVLLIVVTVVCRYLIYLSVPRSNRAK
jgi:Ca2+:H+ antiporter